MTAIISGLPPALDNLAFDSRGNLYLSNANEGSIARILPSGHARVLSPGGMVAPGGVAVLQRPGGRESVFVGDLGTLREFDGRTGLQKSFATGALVGPGLAAPLTVSADGDRLVISSWLGSVVQVWDPGEGQVVEQYPMPIPLNAIRYRDDLVAADLGLGAVVWAGTGEMIL